MARRVSLPGSDEIFRNTSAEAEEPAGQGNGRNGRSRHDEKITVYLSRDQLHDLEAARLLLAREHGLKVDRGRIVREAIGHMLADLADNGPRSTLVRRLHDL